MLKVCKYNKEFAQLNTFQDVINSRRLLKKAETGAKHQHNRKFNLFYWVWLHILQLSLF